MLVACNIPLFKVENPVFKDFMKTHCREAIPTRLTLTRNMEKESASILDTIKVKLAGKDLFIAVDETTDRCGRAMTAGGKQ